MALALASVLADAAGASGFAFYLLLFAVPAAAAAALEAVGELVESRAGAGHAVLGGSTLVLLLAAASVRTPALALGCVLTFALQELAGALVRRPALES